MAKTPLEIRSLARKHTEKAMKTLAAIMVEPSAPHAARVAAANAILDRGWGKPEMKLEADHTHNYVARMPARIADIDEWKKVTETALLQ